LQAERLFDVTKHCSNPEEVSTLSVTQDISQDLIRVQQDLAQSFSQYFWMLLLVLGWHRDLSSVYGVVTCLRSLT